MDFFPSQSELYSAMLQGMIRSEYSTFHNFTIQTNYKCKVYIDGELKATKLNLQKTSMSILNYYFEEFKIYDIQVFLWVDKLYQE